MRLAGHAAHPLMVSVPIGLTVGAMVFDGLAIPNPRSAQSEAWSKGAFALLAAGLVTGVAAASVGFVDWLGLPDGTRAKRVGQLHMAANAASLGLSAISFLLRSQRPSRRSPLAAGLSVAGLGAMAVGGWLGGELIQRLGVGIDPGANPDAPSSLERETVLVHLPRGRQPAANLRSSPHDSFDDVSGDSSERQPPAAKAITRPT